MKILLLGNSLSGKTSLLSRILNISYQKLLEINQLIGIYTSLIPSPLTSLSSSSVSSSSSLNNNNVTFWDISSNLINTTKSIFDYIFYNTNGILLVLDSNNKENYNEIFQWIILIKEYFYNNNELEEINLRKIPIILLANKADLTMKYLNQQILDQLVSRFYFNDWYWTVGHAYLGDYDSRRETPSKQLSINEVVDRMIRLIYQYEIEKRNNISNENNLNEVEPFSIISLQNIPVHNSSIDNNLINNTHHHNQQIQQENGWEYYGGVICREDAELLLSSSSTSSSTSISISSNYIFLVRRSDINLQLRITLLNSDSTISHISLKQTIRDNIDIDNTYAYNHHNHNDNNNNNNNNDSNKEKVKYLSIGKKEFKGMLFTNLYEVLVALGVDLQKGIKFSRIKDQKGYCYIPQNIQKKES